ncbi:MAG: hypothetical protein LBK23_03685 [Oscillospiraceae bacterium]|jgi:hypothetical protein|nr:hypothetical protein [Oscillospiraceae bacterium]
MKIKTSNPRAKTLVTVVLVITLTFLIATPAFAAEETLNETLERQIMEAVGTTDSKSPEFYAMAKMYSDYFLSFLPTDDEPDALQRLTLLPEFDNISDHLQSWDSFFGMGDPVLMRDEAYRIFNDLELADANLSQVDKAKRLSEWAYSGYFSQSVFGRQGKYDGFTYNCNTEAGGLVAVCRLAGIPAMVIPLWMYGIGHVDPFFMLMDNGGM